MTKPVTVRWGPDGSGRSIALPLDDNAGERQALEDLVGSCVPATFGRNRQDVYDENYRRAGAMDTTRFMTDFCPYEHGIIDIITQLLSPPITGDLKTVEPVTAQMSKEEEYRRSRRIIGVVQRFSMRRMGMSESMIHAEDVPNCMAQLGVPIMANDPLSLRLQNMLIESAMPTSNATPSLFPDFLPESQVTEIARERMIAKIRAEHDRRDTVRNEQNTQKSLRQRGIRAALYKLNVYSGTFLEGSRDRAVAWTMVNRARHALHDAFHVHHGQRMPRGPRISLTPFCL